jgi:hypothetical protein
VGRWATLHQTGLASTPLDADPLEE